MIVCVNIIVLGILGSGSWITFLIKWKNDKHLIAIGKIVTGKLIKDEVLTSFEKASLVKAEQEEILVRVIYDEKNPKRYIIYLREVVERLV